MSISTDAILFYGFIWDAELEIPGINDEESEHAFYGLSNDEIEVGFHTHIECPGYFIALKKTYKCAYRGKIINLDDVEWDGFDRENWRGILHDFVEKNRIDLSEAQGPSWFLVSSTDF